MDFPTATELAEFRQAVKDAPFVKSDADINALVALWIDDLKDAQPLTPQQRAQWNNAKRRAVDLDKARTIKRERQLRWLNSNRGRGTQHMWNARARAAGCTVIDFTWAEWLEILDAAEGLCHYCGQDTVKLIAEHRVPLSRGGQHTKSNVVASCQSCNITKRARTDEEYRDKQSL